MQDLGILGITEEDLLSAMNLEENQRYQVRNGEELLTNLEERGFIESLINGLEEITSITENSGAELGDTIGEEQLEDLIRGEDSLFLQEEEISI